ncbi:DNA repair protein RadC [uncultured Clostridium sp.]|uniref:RadC family protein n=1 Tax=uncultured Clostridium sp. TaxID=59620 RepID=UPI0025E26C26|nr:DNA repair protein RadC [uncultured Clostridium sp.]
MTIKELPQSERPYEKLELYGEKSLSNAELLAIIIKTGTKEYTSVDIARKILNLNEMYDETSLSFLRDLSIEEITKIKGMGRIKAIQLKAICELANRMNKPSNYKKTQIKEPNDIVKILMNEMQYEKKEIAKIILLDTKNNILKIKDVAIGGNNFVNIGTKDILSEAVKINAPKIILVHNHPSGNSNPSLQDIEVTNKLEMSAKLLGIKLLDHIVIGKGEYTSIKSIQKWKTKIEGK